MHILHLHPPNTCPKSTKAHSHAASLGSALHAAARTYSSKDIPKAGGRMLAAVSKHVHHLLDRGHRLVLGRHRRHPREPKLLKYPHNGVLSSIPAPPAVSRQAAEAPARPTFGFTLTFSSLSHARAKILRAKTTARG
jgi:hypothetical protein